MLPLFLTKSVPAAQAPEMLRVGPVNIPFLGDPRILERVSYI